MLAPQKSRPGRDWVRDWDELRNAKGWWHSFELPDGTQIDGTNPLEGQKSRIGQFPIPDDLRGKRVLDIGAWDGWFSFEMERRGAEVMAVDNWDNPRFREMHAMLGSRVDYREFDIYDLTPERVGRFDIVLFMGVLYHLKHPLLALERVCALTTEMAAVDSFVLREAHRKGADVDSRPIMEFYETDEFGGQTDNWVAPSIPCLLAFCRTAGFARVELQGVLEYGASIACYRKWEAPSSQAPNAPKLINVAHNTNHGMNFDSRHDEYVSAWFTCNEKTLGLADVKPEVSGYGVKPIHVSSLGEDKFQTNFKLPPGLTAGWHDVTIRVGDSFPSDGLKIAVDVPLPDAPIRITGICDGKTWIPDQVDTRQSDALSVWIEGLPENADRNNLRILLDGRRLRIMHLEPQHPRPRQVNAQLPERVGGGTGSVTAEIGSQRSEAVELTIIA